MSSKTANAYLKIIVVSDLKRAIDDFTKAHPRIAAFAKGVAKAGAIASAAIGALVATFYVLKKAFNATIGKYVEWGKANLGLTRITGITGQKVAELSTQLRLSGVDASKASSGLGFFAKNLDKARSGSGPAAEAFKRLGVEVRNADGSVRSAGDVLADTRTALSQVDDAAKRAGTAAAIFGKGWQSLGPWLTKSADDIKRMNKVLAETGLSWGGKQVKDLKTYLRLQREMTFRWEAFRMLLGQELLPTMNKFMKRASKWLSDKKNQQMLRDFAADIGTIADKLSAASDKTGALQKAFKKLGKAKYIIEACISPISGMARWFGKVVWNADKAWGAIKKIPGAVGRIVCGTVQALAGWFDSVYNAICRAIGALGTLISKIASIPGGILGKIGGALGFAEGGIATGPSSGYTATLHGTEAVVPLDKPRRAAEVLGSIGVGARPVVASAGDTYEFNGCLFAEDFDTVIARANARGASRIARRKVRRRGLAAAWA